MLLSAFCDGGGGGAVGGGALPSRALNSNADESRPTRPSLPSFAPFNPSIASQRRPNPLTSSCRALQAILGGSALTSDVQTLAQSYTPCQPQPQLHTPHRRQLSSPPRLRELGNPFSSGADSINRSLERAVLPPPPPRGSKRRRDEFEEDLGPSSTDTRMLDCPCTPEPLRTPKRRRRIPLAMPLGLRPEDFDALSSPSEQQKQRPPPPSPNPWYSPPSHDTMHVQVKYDMTEELTFPPRTTRNSPVVQQRRPSDQDSAYGSSPLLEDDEWSDADDRVLVELVLAKLRLTKRDWNNCARTLGKDKDSLGRRWSMLVGEGHVGLRRGRGWGRQRASLDLNGRGW